MSITITCDWCQEPIEHDTPRIDLESDKKFTPAGASKPGRLGHFHNTTDCYSQVGWALHALLEARAGLEAIPVLDEEPEISEPEVDDERPAPSPTGTAGTGVATRGGIEAALASRLIEMGITTLSGLNARLDAIRLDERQKRGEEREAAATCATVVGDLDDPNGLAGWLAYLEIETKRDFVWYVRGEELRERKRCERELARKMGQYEKRCREIAAEIGGLADVDDLDAGIKKALFGAGIMTKAQLVRHYYEGTFALQGGRNEVPGIGFKRVREIHRVVWRLLSPAEREFLDALDELLPAIGRRPRRALMRAGVRTFEQADGMSDAALLAINGTSKQTVRALRKAIEAQRGVEVGVDAGS